MAMEAMTTARLLYRTSILILIFFGLFCLFESIGRDERELDSWVSHTTQE